MSPSSNLQNLAILQASISPDWEGRGGGDITIENNSALLPEIGPLGTASNIKSEYLSDGITNYVVRKGDTISAIANMFNISQNTIIWANDLKRGQSLKEGDILVILPISGVDYKVQKGDTLKGIAQKFKADPDEIAKFNGITGDTVLAVGLELIIPDGEIVSVSGSSYASSSSGVPEYSGYYLRPVVGGRRTQGVHGRNGVDLGGLPMGASVMASAPGTVIISRNSGWNGGYGNYVVISHPNGTQTLYSHLKEATARIGAHVDRGETIGLLGNTGKSTGPHLHFEIRGAKNPF